MSARLSALLVWGLVAAVVVFWTLRLTATSIPVPPEAMLAGTGASAGADLSRLLGVRAPVVAQVERLVAPDVAARFKLTGVVAAGRRAGAGVALIAVDGKPPRAFRVGDRVDPQLMLQSVALRSARIGPAGDAPGFTLELPPPAPPATGTLAGAAEMTSMPPTFASTAPAPTPVPAEPAPMTPAPPFPQPAPPGLDPSDPSARLRAQSR